MTQNQTLIYRLHALSRMAQRGFEPSDIRNAVTCGTIIEKYPDDTPYPSCLIMARIADRPVHVVAAFNDEDKQIIIITVYEPDPQIWSDGFTRRKL
jgi:hypothetical protein